MSLPHWKPLRSLCCHSDKAVPQVSPSPLLPPSPCLSLSLLPEHALFFTLHFLVTGSFIHSHAGAAESCHYSNSRKELSGAADRRRAQGEEFKGEQQVVDR